MIKVVQSYAGVSSDNESGRMLAHKHLASAQGPVEWSKHSPAAAAAALQAGGAKWWVAQC